MNAERFWSKVEVRGPNDCWEWQARRTDKGYGQFRVGGRKGRTVHAHRFALELTDPEFDPELDALHTCDNPPCCNPGHLFQGTNADNVRDREAKGRGGSHRGRHAWSEKLTDEQVIEVRARRAWGEKIASIAADMGVSQSLVSLIANNKIRQGIGLGWSPFPGCYIYDDSDPTPDPDVVCWLK